MISWTKPDASHNQQVARAAEQQRLWLQPQYSHCGYSRDTATVATAAIQPLWLQPRNRDCGYSRNNPLWIQPRNRDCGYSRDKPLWIQPRYNDCGYSSNTATVATAAIQRLWLQPQYSHCDYSRETETGYSRDTAIVATAAIQPLWQQLRYSHCGYSCNRATCLATLPHPATLSFHWVFASFMQIRTAEIVMPKSNFLCRVPSFTDRFGWNSVWYIDT